jgi:hypothetical protein
MIIPTDEASFRQTIGTGCDINGLEMFINPPGSNNPGMSVKNYSGSYELILD